MTQELSGAFDRLLKRLSNWQDTVASRRATPELDVGELTDLLNTYSFETPVPLESVVDDVADMLERWNVHTTHPGYFGLFNANVHNASIVADAMVAGYNPQVGLWSHSPAANEIEGWVLRYFTKAFGLPVDESIAHFTTGGSEANFSAIAAALTQACPEIIEHGIRGLPGQPVFYVSEEAHHSVEKSAHLLGLGRSSVRWVATDAEHAMDPGALAQAISEDREQGNIPFLIIGTAGTTTLGSIDPLSEISAIAKSEGLWFHVDAAWGGGAALSPNLRGFLKGIELADSITCDAHKWLSVSMGAGMLFCRHPKALKNTFQVDTPYVTQSIRGDIEPFSTTLQWSRRFIGLKLFMTMAQLGTHGMIEAIESQARVGAHLNKLLEEKGWITLTTSPFPLVCFTHSKIQGGDVSVQHILDTVYDRGKVWLSEAIVPGGEPALRACICNYQTTNEDVAVLVEEVTRALDP